MASYGAAGLTLERRSELKDGTSLGKQVRARIRRRFAVSADLTPAEAMRAAVQAAEDGGWSFPDRSAEVVVGTKVIEGIPAQISVHLSDDDERAPSPPTALTCPPEPTPIVSQ